MNTNFIEKQKEIAKAISNEHESNYYEEDALIFTKPALDTLTETIIKNTLEEVREGIEKAKDIIHADKGCGDDIWDNDTFKTSVHVDSFNQGLKTAQEVVEGLLGKE